MSKSIRDLIADLGLDLCRRADQATACAKTHALKALDGDADEAAKARECRGNSVAFMEAVRAVDDLRVRIEKGDFT